MKKVFKLMSAALMALAMFVPAQAAQLTVFNGQDFNEYVPIYGYYYDTNNFTTQVIYPESKLEAMLGSSITSLKFYVGNESGNTLSGGKVGVSVGITDLAQFPGYSPSLLTGLTEVAEITMTPGETEIVVEFNEPFAYEGGNLVVETTVKQSSGYADLYFKGENVDYYASMYRLPASGSVYAQAFGPKTTFDYQVVDDYAIISTTAIDFGTLYPEQEAAPQTFVLKNLGVNAFTPVFSALEAPFSVAPAATEIAPGTSMAFTVSFAPTELGEYAQTLTIDCGAAGMFEVALTGVKADVPDVITVCDGTDTNGYLPFFGYYYDDVTKGQMIYTADMLSMIAGKKITSVTFYPNAPMTFKGGKLQISFKQVEQDGFTTYTALTDLTVVGTVVPGQGDTELVFTLDEPYEYTGGNLAIEVYNVEKGSNYPRAYFYGQNISGYHPGFSIYGSQNDYVNFLPKVGFEYIKEETPEYVRGDVDGDGEVGISDVSALVDLLLNGGEMPAAADCDEDGEVGISDVSALVDYLLNNVWGE